MSRRKFEMSKFRQSIIFQALLLGTFTLVASALLSTSDIVTRDDIKLRAEEDLKASIGQVVPSKLHDNDLLKSTLSLEDEQGDIKTIYQGTKEGDVTALAYTVKDHGYGGTILAIMAVDPKGNIIGVRILSHAETPGLGDKIEVAKDDWIISFNGLSLNFPLLTKWAVKKDGGHFDQFSGATITPRAVVRAVKSGLEFFESNKDLLLKPLHAEIKTEDAVMQTEKDSKQ